MTTQYFDEPADPRKRYRHGLTWTEEERQRLLHLWDNTVLSPLDICDDLQRHLAGIIPKLRDAGRIWACTQTAHRWWHNPRCAVGPIEWKTDTFKPVTLQEAYQSALITGTGIYQLKEETIMNAPTIETKTFIAGQDAATLTDAQIFAKIAKIEQEIEKLEDIKTKPRKLVAAIEAMQADVKALCEYVDGREAA